ncbi:hypothetical protein Tco_1026268 [Tanacetum coccineum]
MPNVPDEMDEVIQPLIPQPIHTTPPNDDCVAPATNSILDELLDEFDDEIVNVTMVDKEAAKDLQSHFTEIQVHSVITKLEPFIHTRPLSPLCGVFKTSKLCKVNKDIITPGRFSLQGMEFEPYKLCAGGGAWILNKLQGNITNRTSWMLYRRLVKLPVMLDVARGSRLGAWF